MKTTLSVPALAFVALLITPFAAAASSGLPPTITIGSALTDSGSVIEVVGLDFPASSSVELHLDSSAGPLPLGTAATDGSGYFLERATLPADLAPGTWQLRATASDGSTAAGTFLAGSPSLAADVDAVTAPDEAVTAVGNSGSDIAFMIVIAFLIAAVVGGTALAWRLVREDEVQPGMSTGDDPIWSSGDEEDRDIELMAADEHIWGAAHSK